jgi:hypothetical protein
MPNQSTGEPQPRSDDDDDDAAAGLGMLAAQEASIGVYAEVGDTGCRLQGLLFKRRSRCLTHGCDMWMTGPRGWQLETLTPHAWDHDQTGGTQCGAEGMDSGKGDPDGHPHPLNPNP